MSQGLATKLSLGPLLRRRRLQAAAKLWLERLLPAAAPALSVLGLFVALAASGALLWLPSWLRLMLAAATLIFASLWLRAAWQRFARPSAAEIDHQLERRDPHRPLTVLADRPALPGAEAVWQAHREQALARVAALRPGPPALRGTSVHILAASLAAAILALLAGWPAGPARLWATLGTAGAPGAAGIAEAWVVPPAALGLPPIFLRADAPPDQAAKPVPVPVPVGSVLHIAVTGGTARPVLRFGATRIRLARLEQGSFASTLALQQPGTLALRQSGTALGAWPLDVEPPGTPSVTITGQPRPTEHQLSVPWRATDRFGLTDATIEIRLRDRPGAPPISLASTLPGLPRSATGALLPDLTANPWAGLPVLVRVVVHNSSHARGVSADVPSVLPEREFRNKVAHALVLQRRLLVLAPDATDRARANLDRLSAAAASAGLLTAGEWLDLRAIAAQLETTPDATAAIEDRLWQLALAIEDAGATDAQKRLDAAKQNLRDSLTTRSDGSQQNTPQDAQQNTQQQTEALRRALQSYLSALSRQAERNGTPPPQDAQGRPIDPQQLDRMAQDIGKSAAAGRTEEALQKLQQLNALLQQLRPGQQGQLQQAQQQQVPKALQDLMQDQARLEAQSAARLGGESPQKPPSPQADAPAQQDLQQRLGDFASKLGEQNGSVPDALARADGAMRDAAAALARGDDRAANAAQRRALEGLRGGAAQMAQGKGGQGQQRSAGKGKGQGQGGQEAQGGDKPGTDPLGRPVGEGNGSKLGDGELSTEGDAARSRALLDEIRRRAADRTRPPAELEYLDRLLRGTP